MKYKMFVKNECNIAANFIIAGMISPLKTCLPSCLIIKIVNQLCGIIAEEHHEYGTDTLVTNLKITTRKRTTVNTRMNTGLLAEMAKAINPPCRPRSAGQVRLTVAY